MRPDDFNVSSIKTAIKIKFTSKFSVACVGTNARITDNKRNDTTKQWPRRNLLFGPFDSFVMTVPAKDPNSQPYTCISKVAISAATRN